MKASKEAESHVVHPKELPQELTTSSRPTRNILFAIVIIIVFTILLLVLLTR
ncbi:MAG TPA: hypothetical protein VFN56_02930 [Candidatus Saccharimonadales bacterium]|nr:hypothetical protein [Candidatus Saccharimonadales bacterium]